VKAEKDAAALESNAWREDNFKGIWEEMRRREAVRREHQNISEAGKTATAVCEVSKVTVILLRAELFPDAPEPVAKTNGPSAAEV
jgi:hypothetical protein